jgi:multiple sugar transport system substrate-binding protein
LTISSSAVGQEADVLRAQLSRFEAAHSPLRVEIRATPDAADERHQLYVQWLNAHAPDPDVLQLDVVWTAEFAAAGWILNLDRFSPATDDFFPAAITATRWNGATYALPWYVDVGMLYWRRDLLSAPPRTLDELDRMASSAVQGGKTRFGFVWQGARYEGLVTVFLEFLTAYGGHIFDADGRVVVDSEEAVRALTFMRNEIVQRHTVPPAVLAWQEEQVRFAFQNGDALFMRNWPYASRLLERPADSRVAGHVGVAPMPSTPDGTSAAALGGAQLAINAHSDRAEDAYTLIAFLTAPEQMRERTRGTGQWPARRALYEDGTLQDALGVDVASAKDIVEHAVPRPVTPIYAEASEILQVDLHRALTGQAEPRAALHDASVAMQKLLDESGLRSR